jgi:hypothetical protein
MAIAPTTTCEIQLFAQWWLLAPQFPGCTDARFSGRIGALRQRTRDSRRKLSRFAIAPRLNFLCASARTKRANISTKCACTTFWKKAAFATVEINVVSREKQIPHFQTVFATGVK